MFLLMITLDTQAFFWCTKIRSSGPKKIFTAAFEEFWEFEIMIHFWLVKQSNKCLTVKTNHICKNFTCWLYKWLFQRIKLQSCSSPSSSLFFLLSLYLFFIIETYAGEYIMLLSAKRACISLATLAAFWDAWDSATRNSRDAELVPDALGSSNLWSLCIACACVRFRLCTRISSVMIFFRN